MREVVKTVYFGTGIIGLSIAGAVVLLSPVGPTRAAAQTGADPCRAPANAIVAENCKPGSPSTEWDVNGSGDPRIQGFATDISVNVGQRIDFKIKSDSRTYRIDIYRLGYYQGNGARRLTTMRPSVPLPQQQPECLTDEQTRLYDCGNWQVSASWQVPADALSGIYLARMVREDDEPLTWRADNARGRGAKPEANAHAYGALGYGKLANALREPRASHIYFVVRDDASRAAVMFQTSDTSWQAYNRWGWGSSTYGSFDQRQSAPRAYKVSYNRPFENRDYRAVNLVFNNEYPMVRWLEANGYDVTYTTGVDSARRGELIKNHRLFLSVGHDEYWSAEQRQHVEAARDAGVNLGFFAGNDVYWKIRFEPSTDPSRTPYRTLITYKEDSLSDVEKNIDPKASVWTGTWRDPRPVNHEGPKPENALTGTIFTVNAWRNDPLVVPAEFAKLRFWRNTEVAKLQPGQSVALGSGILGHEWNEDLDNGFRPAGLIRMSRTTVNNVRYMQDSAGAVFDSGTATHSLTLYRAPSGALVFSAGTVQWAWGLDPNHDTETGVPPERANSASIRIGVDLKGPVLAIQQATVNLFADMGVQPSTLQPGLLPATASSDTTAPRARITSPTDGARIVGNVVKASGTATDVGGGVVAGIEVSLDGGTRWHPAVGTEEWSYQATIPPGVTSLRILTRAADDSGNVSDAGPPVLVSVAGSTH